MSSAERPATAQTQPRRSQSRQKRQRQVAFRRRCCLLATILIPAAMAVIYTAWPKHNHSKTENPETSATTKLESSALRITASEPAAYMCAPEQSPAFQIYCFTGPNSIIEVVQGKHRLHADPKDLVDRALRQEPEDVLTNFESVNKSDVDEVRRFLDKNFMEIEHEFLKECDTRRDWHENPWAFEFIASEKYREWANEINRMWLSLCREMHDDVKRNPHRYSLLDLPNRFIIPGGRFREFYYWDTYWIIKGLMISGMFDTAKGMIMNMAALVARYGFVPNGGRVYYLSRSHPPMLIATIYDFIRRTADQKFMLEIVPWSNNKTLVEILDQEFQFWVANRSYSGITRDGFEYIAYQFNSDSNMPRPEAYDYDLKTVQSIASEKRRRFVWKNVAAAAESGWDFSSRWMSDRGLGLASTNMRQLLPVDLNAFICGNARTMHLIHSYLNNSTQAKYYFDTHTSLKETVEKLFWDSQRGAWFDYNLTSQSRNAARFYASTAVPLFSECYASFEIVDKAFQIYNYSREIGALDFPSGIPASMVVTGQQWDRPNGWAPLNHMLIEGFRRSKHPILKRVAFGLAERWVQATYQLYKLNGTMWEKMDVEDQSCASEGKFGEYPIQKGFGWTNGVVLHFLEIYGALLPDPVECIDKKAANESGSLEKMINLVNNYL